MGEDRYIAFGQPDFGDEEVAAVASGGSQMIRPVRVAQVVEQHPREVLDAALAVRGYVQKLGLGHPSDLLVRGAG